MKKTVSVFAFICPECRHEHGLLEFDYHPPDFDVPKEAFRSDYLIRYSCGSRVLNVSPQKLYSAKREIDQDEPLWATAMLLRKAAHLREIAQWHRDKEPSSALWLGVANIRDNEAAELVRIACEGSGKQKEEACF